MGIFHDFVRRSGTTRADGHMWALNTCGEPNEIESTAPHRLFYRYVSGQPVLGYLNPWIYKNAASWNDIKTGASSGCGGEDDGWPAVPGWDAVTGVGTPNYKNLVQIAPGTVSRRPSVHTADPCRLLAAVSEPGLRSSRLRCGARSASNGAAPAH